MLSIKQIKSAGYVAAAVGAAAMYGVQAVAATASATASATITDAPITITSSQPLTFGDIGAGSNASVIDITPAGVRSLESGDATLGATAGTAGVFDVSGEPSKAYTVTLPTAPVTLSDGGVNSMTVDNFVSDASGIISASGTDSFNVGAKLNVAANQAAGSYSGSFSVEVVY